MASEPMRQIDLAEYQQVVVADSAAFGSGARRTRSKLRSCPHVTIRASEGGERTSVEYIDAKSFLTVGAVEIGVAFGSSSSPRLVFPNCCLWRAMPSVRIKFQREGHFNFPEFPLATATMKLRTGSCILTPAVPSPQVYSTAYRTGGRRRCTRGTGADQVPSDDQSEALGYGVAEPVDGLGDDEPWDG